MPACIVFHEADTLALYGLHNDCEGLALGLASLCECSFQLIEVVAVNSLNSKAESIVDVAMNLDALQNFGMFSLVTIVPGLSLLLCAIPLFFYDLTGKKKEKIFSELAVLRKERGIEIDE